MTHSLSGVQNPVHNIRYCPQKLQPLQNPDNTARLKSKNNFLIFVGFFFKIFMC